MPAGASLEALEVMRTTEEMTAMKRTKSAPPIAFVSSCGGWRESRPARLQGGGREGREKAQMGGRPMGMEGLMEKRAVPLLCHPFDAASA